MLNNILSLNQPAIRCNDAEQWYWIVWAAQHSTSLLYINRLIVLCHVQRLDFWVSYVQDYCLSWPCVFANRVFPAPYIRFMLVFLCIVFCSEYITLECHFCFGLIKHHFLIQIKQNPTIYCDIPILSIRAIKPKFHNIYNVFELNFLQSLPHQFG